MRKSQAGLEMKCNAVERAQNLPETESDAGIGIGHKPVVSELAARGDLRNQGFGIWTFEFVRELLLSTSRFLIAQHAVLRRSSPRAACRRAALRRRAFPDPLEIHWVTWLTFQ
jgi:hypothetical protein